ncbi:MAG: hypothetical protein M1817_006105 [Caeruleum heppii]|nr:MAG: hypothetical protein M1817_006105 [Caeruleum heppii]
MARLNDPPAATESIDSLKRRFVRQNREIARANSAQSLRIRSLESETARLLSENISLREEIIRLQNEVDRNNDSDVLDGVQGFRSHLESTIRDLTGIVTGLGQLQDVRPSHHHQSAKNTRRTSRRYSDTPNHEEWRNRPALSEVTGNAEGKLPPIVEGKYYPRRTLSGDRLPDPANAVESPDSEPPPIAHLDEEDLPTSKSERDPESDGFLSDDVALPFNLETRKKRRGSTTLAELRRIHRGEAESEPGKQHLKIGAKRKLGAREDEDASTRDEPRSDGFVYSRTAGDKSRGEPAEPVKSPKKENVESRTTKEPTSAAAAHHRLDTNAARLVKISGRKALGQKSVNSDPVVSPTKANVKPDKDPMMAKKDPAKSEVVRHRSKDRKAPTTTSKPSTRVRPTSREIPFPEPQTLPPEPKREPEPELEPEPETPAALDLFSPHSSEPSTARPKESRDTPPPSSLQQSGSSVTGLGDGGPTAALRIARRARPSVSYAEPNLRDKMRRPGKELVDAVTVGGKGVRGVEGKSAEMMVGGLDGTTESMVGAVRIKKEEGVESDARGWKDLEASLRNDAVVSRAAQGSPLEDKSSSKPLPSVTDYGTATTKPATSISVHTRPPREPAAQRRHLPELETLDKHPSAAAAAMSALVSGSRRARPTQSTKPLSQEDSVASIQRAVDKLDIYDFQATSPARKGAPASGSVAIRTGRRQSGMERKLRGISPSRQHETDTELENVSASDTEREGGRDAAPTRNTARRRQTLAHSQSSESENSPATHPSPEPHKPLESSRSDAVLGQTFDRAGRGERAARRRKSMLI